MKPFYVIEDSVSRPDRVAGTRRMLSGPGVRLEGHLFDPEVWAYDGKVYVFLPGIVLVYDYHEFMAELREGNT